MHSYLLLIRLNLPIEHSPETVEAIKELLPCESTPVFFGNDSFVLGLRSEEKTSAFTEILEPMHFTMRQYKEIYGRPHPASKIKDWSISEVATRQNWACKFHSGPMHHWLYKYDPIDEPPSSEENLAKLRDENRD